MTHDEMLAALAPPRLPAEMAVMDGREMLALVGLGLLLGLLAAVVLRPLMMRRPSRRALIRATRGQPAPERILSIARILGHLPAGLRDAAYGAATPPPDPEIERIAARSKARR